MSSCFHSNFVNAKNILSINFSLIFLLLFYSFPLSADELPLDKVVLQLKWFHQFQFAGYYAAKAKGFYQQEGLDVEIRQRDPKLPVIGMVVSGQAQYGISDSSAVVNFANGDPVVALAAIMQHDPLVLISKKSSGIVSPQEMRGKKIMFDASGGNEAPIVAMMTEAGITSEFYSHIPSTFSNEDLEYDRVDAMPGYVNDQPFYFKQKGIEINIINPLSYGLDFYGDILLTSRNELTENPLRAYKFRRASLRGWKYALENPDEIIDIILQQYQTDKSKEYLKFEANGINKLILPDVIPLGSIDINRFKRVVGIYQELHLTHAISAEKLSEFIYNPPLQFELSTEENDWLKQHPVIRVGIDRNFAPFEWLDDDDNYQGMTSDYIKLLQNQLPVTFEVVKGKTWQETLDMARKGELDMLTDANLTDERDLYLDFTEPFIESPVVIINNNSKGFIGDLNNLSGKKIAIESGYFMQEILRRDYPQIEQLTTDSEIQALHLVEQGIVDAYVGDGISLNYFIQSEGLLTLRYSGSTNYSSQHRMAVSHKSSQLLGILKKALHQITQQERDAIHQRWMGLTIQQGLSIETVLKYLMIGLLLFIIVIYYLFKLRKSEHALAVSENKLNEILKNIDVYVYLKDKRGKYLYANQQVCKLWNTQLDKVIGAGDEQFFDELTVKNIRQNDQLVFNSGLAFKNEETNTDIQSGLTATYLSTKIPLRDNKGQVYALLGVSTDITERIKAEKRERNRSNILEMLSKDIPLDDILSQLISDIEQEYPDAFGSFLLVDKALNCLRLGAAPSLPDFYNEAIDGVSIGIGMGSCGEAAFTGNRFITEDIQSHPNWEAYKALAAKAGLASCWSQPVKSSSGEVIGTLAIYYRKIRTPGKSEISAVEQMANLAGIAIEKSIYNKKLLSQKQLLQVLIDEFPDYFAMKNWQGAFLLANKTMADFYGTTPELMTGKVDFDFTGDRHQADSSLENLQQVMRKFETDIGYEESINVHTGQTRHYKSIKKPLRDENGNLQILIIEQDITEIVNSKNEAEASSNFLNYVLNATNEGVWDWNLKTNMISHNPQWSNIMGIQKYIPVDSYENLIQRIVAEDRDAFIRAIKESVKNKTVFKSEHRRVKDNGDIFWVFSRGQVVEWDETGEPVRMVGATGDITERKQAESKIIENEQLLRTSIEALGEAFAIFDTEDRLVFFNDQYKKMYEASKNLIQKGRTFEEILRYGCDHGQYEDAKGCEMEWIKQRLAIHNQQSSEVLQELSNGRWLNVRERKTPLGYTVGYRLDITDLYKAKQNADIANKAKSSFLATMSHEIRTPMNGVLGMVQLLEDTDLDTEQKEYVSLINKSGQNLLHIINNVLDFSKLDSAKMTLEKIDFNLVLLCQECVDMMDNLAQQKNLKLVFEYDAQCPFHFNGDLAKIKQVLVNLIGNAIKFTHQGFVKVSVEKKIEDDDAGLIEISVEDSGIGINNQAQETLFEEFTQADQATTREFGGTGLGLAITRKLVSLMGGNIRVESTEGVGSVFTVSLQLTETAVPETDNQLNSPPETGKNKLDSLFLKILVVEDVIPNQIIARKFLQGFDCKVILAADGRQAVELWRKEKFDLILMDCRMPVMDGYEATRKIRQQEKIQNIEKPVPILALTANASEEDRIACKAAGMNDVITKPFKREMLFQKLQFWNPLR